MYTIIYIESKWQTGTMVEAVIRTFPLSLKQYIKNNLVYSITVETSMLFETVTAARKFLSQTRPNWQVTKNGTRLNTKNLRIAS